MSDDVLLTSLLTAVTSTPDDVPLRLHVAGLLAERGRSAEALQHCIQVLARDASNTDAMGLLQRLTSGITAPPTPDVAAAPPPAEPAPVAPPAPDRTGQHRLKGYDWTHAEEEVAGTPEPVLAHGESSPVVEDIEQPGIRLADVGGMEDVKQRLELAFLGPMRNPELAKAFGKTLTGGLLLYGPPGCGKTFIARAVAGELGARFIAVSFADIIDMFVGQSERNIHELFEIARRNAPCVLFLDEVDAIGQKRSQLRNTPMRSAVNQLLLELDDVDGGNDGVFLLAATNHPWDVDSALRRPGRFDRTLLVLPPDNPAREAIFRYHLRDRPVAGVNLGRLANLTDGYSGADIAHICETASQRALMDSVKTGEERMLGWADLEAS